MKSGRMNARTKAALKRIAETLGCSQDDALQQAVETLDSALAGDEALVMTKRDLALCQLRFAEYALSGFLGRPHRVVVRDGEMTFEETAVAPAEPPFMPVLATTQTEH